jgi:hypothetical protein
LESKTNIQNEVNYCVEQAIGEFIKTWIQEEICMDQILVASWSVPSNN